MKEMLTGLNSISAYGLCGVTGFLLGIGYLFVITRVRSEDFGDTVYVYVWAALGAVIGAKALYLLLELPKMIRTFGNGEAVSEQYLRSIVSGGFIFYGGLLGSVFAVKIACRFFALDFGKTISILTPAMPLAHALGRVGCSLVGCCYGRETQLFIGICYTDSVYAPNGVPLFPVQAMEAAADLVLFSVLVWILWRQKDNGGPPGVFEIYLAAYACIRFLLEFLRGDSVRGHWGWFSTSQWISLIILTAIGVQKISKGKSRKKQAQ